MLVDQDKGEKDEIGLSSQVRYEVQWELKLDAVLLSLINEMVEPTQKECEDECQREMPPMGGVLVRAKVEKI